MRALVVAHEDDGGPGLVGARLEERGVRLEVAQIARGRDRGPDLLPALDGYDAVVSLGCTEAVFDRSAVGDWIDPELDLLRTAHDEGVPVLGICFGGQALAAALGSTVERSPAPEIGWFELELTSAPVGPIATGPWMVWHLDRFTVPPGAVELARTQLCSHAFRAGRSVGLQFHPEVDADSVTRWALGAGSGYFEAKGIDQGVLLDGIAEKAEAAAANTVRLIDWFLDEVTGS
ncbi:MAG: type 1 glutamine amidotransferase [Acidimicrobiia bacterium]